MEPLAVVASARSGDFGPILSMRGQSSGSPAGWSALFDVLCHLAGYDVEPDLAAIVRFGRDPVGRIGAAYAAAELIKVAWLRFDHELLRDAARVGGTIGASGEAAVALTLGQALELLLAGRRDEALEALATASDRARAIRSPHLVVESTAFRALALLETGDTSEALAVARRASRMARAEQQPGPEYLANIVLARARRSVGQPHLATRILTALGRVAPPPFWPWIAWELCLSDGPHSIPSQTSLSALHDTDPSAVLKRMLIAAIEGGRTDYDAAHASLEQRVQSCPFLARDVERLAFMLDGSQLPAAGPRDAMAWAEGRSDTVPFGLTSLDGSQDSEHAAAAAWVYAPANGPPRRILSVGVPLVLGAGGVAADKQQRKQGRVETALAILTLEHELTMPELFRAVYGFNYVQGIHRGKANTLLNRMRAHVPPGASLEREGERLRLRTDVSFVVPDPRCARTLEDRVLALVARAPGATARDAARALGVSLRSAQAALETLVDDGTCLRSRDHRQVGYQVEDTTFREPTRI